MCNLHTFVKHKWRTMWKQHFFAACDDGLLIGYAIKVMIGQMMQMEIFIVK